ncbi:MAG: glutathione S-transferase [Pseudomonadota bacterium]
MRLIYSPTSPYVRKVMVLLHETGQLEDIALDRQMTTPLDPAEAILPTNPLGKVPALVRNEGPALFDSRVICAFLDARADAGLYGSGERLWATQTLEALADGILDAALLIAYETRMRPEQKQMTAWADAQWGKVARGCAAIEARWMSHLAGPLDMGQIAVGCALGYLDLRHAARGWRTGNDALANWFETFDSLPSMVATRPSKG